MNKDQFLFIFIVASLLCVLIHIGSTCKIYNENGIVEPDSLPPVKIPESPIKPIQQPKTLSKW